MTINELRQHEEYAKSVEKIRNYPKGFEFTIYFHKIPKAKANALNIILRDCMDMGLIDSVSIGLNLDCEIADETYRRL